MKWLHAYAEIYKEKITKNKLSTKRVMKLTKLPLEYAQTLSIYCRTNKISKELPDIESGSLQIKPNYVYNQETDTYITYLPGVPKPIVLSGSQHREIVQSYSKFSGSNATINDIARTVEMPRAWVSKYLKAHEITHDHEPFSNEEILDKQDEDLIHDALQIRKASLYKKLEQAKWADIQNDAMKWRSFEGTVLRELTTAIKQRLPEPALEESPLQTTPNPFAVVVGLTDFHWGKYSDVRENFEAYNREIASSRLFQMTERALKQLSLFGTPEKFYVPIGSDFFHCDNDQGTTAKGTKLDLDGTPAEILVSGCQMLESWIGRLGRVASVELVLMSGNHDRMFGIACLLYLEAAYRNNSRVIVKTERTPRIYKTYGSNLIGFIHGDTVSKTSDMAGHMAREASKEWSTCEHKTIYTGHLHSERTEVDNAFGVIRRQIPSLSGPDRWHALHGFMGAPKRLPLYIHNKVEGPIAIFQ